MARSVISCHFERSQCRTRDRGQCFDHNFRRFLTNFGEKIGVFLKNQCYYSIPDTIVRDSEAQWSLGLLL
jgi:hypothetical protein